MDQNPTFLFVQPKQVIIEERARPQPGPGELLIQTRCTLISIGTELTILSGQFPPQSAWAEYGKFPFVPGYNNIGDVIAVGGGVDSEWLGRRVGTYGPHARYVVQPADSARVIRHEVISDEEAVFFTLGEIVMNGVRRGCVQWGESVVIYGAGLLGQLAAQFCHFAGARPVCVMDVAGSRLQKLPQNPAIVALNPQHEDVVARVAELTHGRMADVVFEVTGNPQVIPEEFGVLRQQGRMVLLSSPKGPTWFDFHDLCNAPGYAIIGAHNRTHPQHATFDNPWTNLRHAQLFFDMVAAGDLNVASLISHRAHYTEGPALYDMLLRDRTQAMGVVLDW